MTHILHSVVCVLTLLLLLKKMLCHDVLALVSDKQAISKQLAAVSATPVHEYGVLY